MNRFELAQATSTAEARELLAEKKGAVLKAGGIDLLDHLKEHLLEPPRVVDLKRIAGLDQVAAEPDGSLRIGPLVTLAKVAAHPTVQKTATSSSVRGAGTTASSRTSASRRAGTSATRWAARTATT